MILRQRSKSAGNQRQERKNQMSIGYWGETSLLCNGGQYQMDTWNWIVVSTMDGHLPSHRIIAIRWILIAENKQCRANINKHTKIVKVKIHQYQSCFKNNIQQIVSAFTKNSVEFIFIFSNKHIEEETLNIFHDSYF